jgi:hypothetical protein
MFIERRDGSGLGRGRGGGDDLVYLADLMGCESVDTRKRFYAVFRVDELARQHVQFSSLLGVLAHQCQNAQHYPE